jgi:hypothetical protein
MLSLRPPIFLSRDKEKLFAVGLNKKKKDLKSNRRNILERLIKILVTSAGSTTLLNFSSH